MTAWRNIPAFCINLARRHDRWLLVAQEFKKLAWSVSRFSAVEASPGWLGCSASHRALWRHALETRRDVIAVFEDDVVFPNDFINIISVALAELPKDWEFWQLHSSHAKYRPIGKYVSALISRGWGTHGYFITARGCERLLALPENKVDSLVTEDFILSGGRPYGVLPQHTLCFQRGDDSDIAETAQTDFWRRQVLRHARRFGTGAK